MIDVNTLRRRSTFIQDGDLYKVLEYSHNKPGRGKATIRVSVRDLRTGTIREMTFISGDRVQNIRLDTTVVEYLYEDDEFFHFMNIETYEQPVLRKDLFDGDDALFLTQGMQLKLSSYENEILDYELPTTVDHEVTEAENAVAGNTAGSASKYVKTQTGLQVQVPLFVSKGDTIRVDTRTSEYVTRV